MRKLIGRRRFWSYKTWKFEEVSHEMLVLRLQHVLSRFSGFLAASPFLRGSCKTSHERRFPNSLSCSFAWHGWNFVTSSRVCKRCRKWFCVTGAKLLQVYQKMIWIFRGQRSTSNVSIFILRGRRSTLGVLCCVFLASGNVRAASSGDKVHIAWQAWDMCGVSFSWQAQYSATLHFTLHTPHFTLYTSHSTRDTLHHTLHFTLHTLHSTLCTLHSALYTPHSTLHTLHSTLDTVHSTLHTLHVTLHTLHFTLYTSHFTLYTLHFTLCTFYFQHLTPHTLHSTL